jgi:predicted anti-sigma-YlaC factor YlaD
MTGTRALTCRAVSEFLAAYLADELAAAERARFDDHLSQCPDCRAYLRQYEATIRLAKDASAADDAIGAAIPDALVDAILAATGRMRRDGRR